jgi:hypothetical protein
LVEEVFLVFGVYALVEFVFAKGDGDEVVEAEFEEVHRFEGVLVKDEQVGGEMYQLADRTELSLLLCVVHCEGGNAHCSFDVMFVFEIFFVDFLYVLC